MISVNGVVLPNPSNFVWGEHDLSSEASGRNLAGEMLKDVVAVKVKIELEWGPLKPAQVSTILQAATQATYLNVTYPDPKVGGITTKVMYVGDRDTEMLRYHNQNGVEYWSGVKFNFIEK